VRAGLLEGFGNVVGFNRSGLCRPVLCSTKVGNYFAIQSRRQMDFVETTAFVELVDQVNQIYPMTVRALPQQNR
jgi:hypothetical protein